MKSQKSTQEIPLNKLEPGMFVVKLDISWLDSPFLKNSRLIKSQSDIEKLREAGVKVVSIDISKGKSLDADKRQQAKEVSFSETQVENLGTASSKVQSERKSIRDELNTAKSIRSKLNRVIEDLNAQLERDLPINTSNITPFIDQTVESLERNNQALLSLSHISRKSKKISDHCFSTFCLALSIERVKALSNEERYALGIAALLHDTGWLHIPLQLMGKRTKYSVSERKLISSHPKTGVSALKRSDIPELVLRIIDEHHEKPNGTGYPRALKGDEIHPASKILGVADSYDESVHQLTDKPGMLPTNALRKLYKDAENGLFDLESVKALINVLGIYPVTSAVILNTGERAIIEDVPPDAHLAPSIIIHYDKNLNPIEPPLRVDLAHQSQDEPERKIVSVFDPHSPQEDPDRRIVLSVD